jgi:hypothetical protein
MLIDRVLPRCDAVPPLRSRWRNVMSCLEANAAAWQFSPHLLASVDRLRQRRNSRGFPWRRTDHSAP